MNCTAASLTSNGKTVIKVHVVIYVAMTSSCAEVRGAALLVMRMPDEGVHQAGPRQRRARAAAS